jgi:hypothetical protein
MYRKLSLIGLVLIVVSIPVLAQTRCDKVGGVLMTNIGAIAGETNLGPVFGDLAGSVAATVMGNDSDGNYLIQHYWVTNTGDTIIFKLATLKPTLVINAPHQKKDSSLDGDVAVPWGYYRSYIANGTGKFEGAKGYLDYFGIADFGKMTLVLRYEGKICH